MPTYRVQATTKTFPKPTDWTTTLETDNLHQARAATGTFNDRPYPNKTYWQRLFEDETIILIRRPIKPHVTYRGRNDRGVQLWWVAYVDKDGYGGSHGAHGPLTEVYADLMRSHHWYIKRHRLARA